MMGKQNGQPQGPRACTGQYWGQLPWGEQKEGLGGDLQAGCWHTSLHPPVNAYLPCLQIHVPDTHIHLRDFYALLNVCASFYVLLFHILPLSWSLSQSLWMPRSGLGHLCDIFFSPSSNPKQLLVHRLWALGTPRGFMFSPASLTLSFYSCVPAFRLLPATELWRALGSPPQGSASPQWTCRTSPPKLDKC